MNLVIVESPAKAKTINKYLGKDFEVLASFGHVRDLPSKPGSVIPEKDFAMLYQVSDASKKHIDKIVQAAKSSDIIYLATDPDREGESISWHIVEVLKDKGIDIDSKQCMRIAFNEITKKAILKSIKNARKIDMNLVNAQQVRRALDYLVGFTLSPLLWRKLPSCKSAGRVQSVALRLICEQEEKIEQFISREYWDILFNFENTSKKAFKAKLHSINNNRLEKFDIPNSNVADSLLQELNNAIFYVDTIEKKQQKKQPTAPFITSSLQQEAARKLGFSAKKTMQVAQKLYEGLEIDGSTTGLITYMRTDGVSLSDEAISSIRNLIKNTFGEEYLPSNKRIFKSKVKNAQEAHEAIRPTDILLTPDALKGKLEKDYYNLYDLIWKRTVASQMENVVIDIVSCNILSNDSKFMVRASGSTIVFDGFYRIYQEDKDEEDLDETDENNKKLPKLEIGEKLVVNSIVPNQHFTEAPPRFTEASLVKKLEELGIGRPSTYATILSVLQERKYVDLTKKKFLPDPRGRLLTAFLVRFFAKYVQYDFTAGLESELDEIASGNIYWKTSLSNFWNGFYSNISLVEKDKLVDIITNIESDLKNYLFKDTEGSINDNCKNCINGKLHLKIGKYGAFLACSNYPTCNYKKTITNISEDNSNDISSSSYNNVLLGVDINTKENIYSKKGPYGRYVQLGEDLTDGKKNKPKRVKLPPFVNHENITLEIAQKMLSLPIVIGQFPSTNQDIILDVGRYGPYLKYCDVFYNINKNIDYLSMNLQEAVNLINTSSKKKESKNSK